MYLFFNVYLFFVCFYCRIGGVFMTTAIETPTDDGLAYLVEECTCPTGYTGLSCQVMLLVHCQFLPLAFTAFCNIDIHYTYIFP